MARRLISILIAILISISFAVPTFSTPANPKYTAGETLKAYGIISGDEKGNLNEKDELSRAEMAVLLAALNGKSEEAKAFKLRSTFTDIDNSKWYAPYVAYAEAMNWTKGVGGGKYAPDNKVTIKEAAAFLMNVLGKKYDYNNTILQDARKAGIKNGLSGSKNADGSVDGNAYILRGDVFAAMLDTLLIVPEGKDKPLCEILGYFKASDITGETSNGSSGTKDPKDPDEDSAGPAEVKNIEANSEKSFKVTFLRDVADRSKITFSVKRLFAPIPVKLDWEGTRDSVILTASSKLVAGVYEVKVFENSREITTSNVIIEDRRIDKIDIVSPTLAIIQAPGQVTSRGYAAYRVYDQYGEDMTNEVKASELVFSSSLGTAQGGSGAIVVTPHSNLISFTEESEFSISVIESRTGTGNSKMLKASFDICPLSDFNLVQIGDIQNGSTDPVYIPYNAYDVFGFETENYDVITAGLRDMDYRGMGDNEIQLIHPSNAAGISVDIVRDTNDSSKARIRLTAGNKPLTTDSVQAITANTTAGKTSTILVKVKK
jgi:hypothetical protein